tara:strand:+ start:1110 stop:1601 length:492 start_codon:yes stop_codon:yes gene_type:complete
MAKKKLILNEAVTRRFMKLAEIDSAHASQFINELEEEDPMAAGPEDAGMGDEGAPADLGAEEPEEDELAAEEEPAGETISLDAEAFVGDIVDLLQQHGADVELDTGAEEAPMEEPVEDEGEMELAPEEAPAEDEEEMMMQEVARRVSQRLLDAVKLSKTTTDK